MHHFPSRRPLDPFSEVCVMTTVYFSERTIREQLKKKSYVKESSETMCTRPWFTRYQKTVKEWDMSQLLDSANRYYFQHTVSHIPSFLEQLLKRMFANCGKETFLIERLSVSNDKIICRPFGEKLVDLNNLLVSLQKCQRGSYFYFVCNEDKGSYSPFLNLYISRGTAGEQKNPEEARFEN